MNYIFDVDGTLTPARRQMDLSFMAWFIIFECKHPVYLVTGSDRQKTIDQVGLDVYNRARRVYNCSGSDVWEGDRNIEPFEPAFIPSLFRTKVLKFYLSLMNNESNPEAQIKNIYRNNLYNIRKYFSINFKTNIELSHDIGREWLKKKGLKRDYDKHRNSSIKSKNWSPWTTWTYS